MLKTWTSHIFWYAWIKKMFIWMCHVYASWQIWPGWKCSKHFDEHFSLDTKTNKKKAMSAMVNLVNLYIKMDCRLYLYNNVKYFVHLITCLENITKTNHSDNEGKESQVVWLACCLLCQVILSAIILSLLCDMFTIFLGSSYLLTLKLCHIQASFFPYMFY